MPHAARPGRQAELECACRALGIAPPLFLDHRDGTLSQVNDQQAAAEIGRVIRSLQPQAVLTWPPDGLSGHPDHIAVSRWTGLALEQATARGHCVALYHIVLPQSVTQALQMPHLHAVPDEQVTLTVDVGAAWEQKLAAIACHRTQAGSSPILTAPAERQRLFLGTEHFQRAVATGSLDLLVTLLQTGANAAAHQRAPTSKP